MNASTNRFILALDCTALQGSIAVLKGTTLVSEEVWVRGQSHAELVIPAIEASLKKTGITVADLSLLVVCHGPGSFTGVRVGINVMRSFAYANNLPTLEFTSLELWAEAHLKDNQSGVIALPAHDGTFLVSQGRKDANGILTCSPVEKATATDLEVQKSKPNSGTLILASPDKPWPKAEVLAKIALREVSLRRTKDWKALAPLYVRASSAEEKIGKV